MKKLFYKNGKLSPWRTIRNIVVVIVLIIAAVAGYLSANVLNAVQNTNQQTTVQSIRDTHAEITQGDAINVLVVGTDGGGPERIEEEGFVSRSDTLIVINLNPETQTTKMLSIPRDTLTDMDGYEEPDKINHAYAFGGIDLTIDTVQDFLQIPIDYYAVVNMDGLASMIDALGGIEVTSPLTFEYRGTQFHEGEKRQVDGVKAMNFARMRYDDPEGELGRQNRQKMVIKAIIDKALSLDAVSQYPRLIQVASEYVKTNVNLSDALAIYQQYLPALKAISAIQFESMEELYIDDIFYYHIPLSARVKVANEFRRLSNMVAITASDLIDPLGVVDDQSPTAKSLTIITNQYPTGLNDEQLQELLDRQETMESIRNQETDANIPTPGSYYPVTPPAQSTPPTGGSNNSGSYLPAPPPEPDESTAPPIESLQPTTPPDTTIPTEPEQPAAPNVTDPASPGTE